MASTVGAVVMMAEQRPALDRTEPDPLEGLPPDLARVLRDPSIFVPQDQAVFELVANWIDAPSDTASAMSVDEWRQAWSVTCQRMLKALERVSVLEAQLAEARAGLERVTDLDSFPIETDDGEWFMGFEAEAVLRIVSASLAASAEAGDAAEPPPCTHPSTSFDRTVCACGAMHNYCERCGVAVDCPLDGATEPPEGDA